MNQKRLKSEIIADFLNLFDDSKTEFEIAEEYVEKANHATMDMLHSIEFESSSKERSKMATQLRDIRLDRRYYKDIVEETEPINQYYNEYKKSIDMLKQVLGKVRKAESYHENREYKPRFFKKGD